MNAQTSLGLGNPQNDALMLACIFYKSISCGQNYFENLPIELTKDVIV